MPLLTLIAMLLVPFAGQAAEAGYEVVVTDPYIELHSGPGRGYPVFHVVDRGEQVAVLKRRTDWYRIRTGHGVEGWADARAMSRTMQPDGRPARIENPDRDDYSERRREFGLQIGDFDGANILSVYGAWMFTPNLSAELWGSHITGDFSDGWMLNASVVHQPFPEWWLSPFFTIGTGIVQISPKATLVDSEDRTDQLAHVGFGLRTHLSRRFLLRAEYKSYVVFTSRDDNEEVEEWKAGFSFFF